MLYRKLVAPMSLQWELTSWCNHKCIHCYNYWRGDSCGTPDFLSQNDQDKIVSEVIANQVFDVCITGGEPLSVIEHYESALKRLHENNVYLSINTNMAMITQTKLDLLKSVGIGGALVSIVSGDKAIHDAITGRPGSFERVVEGIKLARNSGMNISISLVCTKKNLHTIRATGQLAKDLGARSFCVTKASWPSWRPDFNEFSLTRDDVLNMYDEMIAIHDDLGLEIDTLVPCPVCGFATDRQREILGHRGCGAGRSSAIIGSTGQLRPCPQSEENCGSVLEIGLRGAWDNMQPHRDGDLIPEFCKNHCEAFPHQCQGGCRTDSKNACGSLTAEDPMCTRKIVAKKPDNSFQSVAGENPQFAPNKNLRFRKEEFGYMAYAGHFQWLAIEETLQKLLSLRKPFGIPEVCQSVGANDKEARALLGLLLKRKAIFLCESVKS